jgi:hypothetical protein
VLAAAVVEAGALVVAGAPAVVAEVPEGPPEPHPAAAAVKITATKTATENRMTRIVATVC